MRLDRALTACTAGVRSSAVTIGGSAPRLRLFHRLHIGCYSCTAGQGARQAACGVLTVQAVHSGRIIVCTRPTLQLQPQVGGNAAGGVSRSET